MMKVTVLLMAAFGPILTGSTGAWAAPPAGEQGPAATRSGPDIRRGRLPNGLSYFIERTSGQADKVQVLLNVRVGLMHTMPADTEAAHVLEHVVVENVRDRASKGTLLDRLKPYGGRIYGASTSWEMTSYGLMLPAGDAVALSTGLDILTDWASPLPISDEDVDRELKVVAAESRNGNNAQRWSWTMMHRTWYPDSPAYHAVFPPVGTVTSTHAGVRALHSRYYVPGNMAVIVTGPVDPDAILAELEKSMGRIPAGQAGAQPDLTIPALKGGGYVPITHPDQRTAEINISYKIRRAAHGTEARVKEEALYRLAGALLRDSIGELSARYGAPVPSATVAGASYNYASYIKAAAVDVWAVTAQVRPGKIGAAFTDLFRFISSVRRVGFSSAEIEQARAMALPEIRSDPATDAASKWQAYFQYGDFGATPLQLRTAIDAMTVAEVNAGLRKILDPAQRDIFVIHPEQDRGAVPSRSSLARLIAAADRAPPIALAPPAPKVPTFAPIPPEAIAPVAAVPETNGYLRWRLPRSGATLLFRKTDADALIVMGRPGGASRLPAALADAALIAGDVVVESGFAGLDGFEARRFLDTARIAILPIFRYNREGLRASGPVEQWPLLVRVTRAQIMQPQCRPEAFDDYLSMIERVRHEAHSSALSRISLDSAVAAATGRRLAPQLESRPDFRATCDAYAAMLSDTSDMTIVVEGKLDSETVYRSFASTLDIPARGKPGQLERHALPDSIASRTVVNDGLDSATVILVLQHGKRVTSADASGLVIKEIMKRRLTDRLRRVEKGVYSVIADYSIGTSPDSAAFGVEFKCAPGDVERLIGAVKDELRRVREEGVSADELAYSRRFLAEQPVSADSTVENWIAWGTVSRHPLPDDQQVQLWIRGFFDPAKLAEFVQLPVR
ncbi:M16 family metallopeptidase [Sphingomonas colocasiae]|uniref:Insulinase family protein n=1 Tax=Sphingomonas colocasiae TaxID=1848973 RepID=A0ABS7PPH4_9SPHN|nr:insulinase family protein [Sphingomonas colocasiae]MBY8823222.1 insulinase family protein [Sphingomonas colocasiae]